MSTAKVIQFLFLLLNLNLIAQAQTLEFRHNGKTLTKKSLAQIKTIAPPVTLKLDKGLDNYWVIPLKTLLDQLYKNPDYSQDISFVFVCQDGYRSPVQAQELKKFPAYLAFACADGKPFTKEKKTLAPFYLVWDTKKYPQRTTEGNWPYQIKAIDRVSFSQTYSKVLPPANSSPQVQQGFELFRKHCLSCHQINGQGGNKAMDLNYPYSVTEYINHSYLSQIIDRPRQVRAQATMPDLAINVRNKTQAIKNIIAYLEAKAAQRRTKSKATKPGK